MSAKYKVTQERIQELIKADSEGRVAVLPCKYGDSMYHIKRIHNYTCNPKTYCYVVECQLTEYSLHNFLFNEEYRKLTYRTREEAEAALPQVAADFCAAKAKT